MVRKLLFAVVGLVPAVAFAATPPPSPAFPQEAFTDIKSTHANFEAVEYLRTNNVLKGYTDGTFQPDRRISRAEFVMLITNPLILQGDRVNNCVRENLGTGDPSTNVYFPDVRRDDWFADAVCIAHVKDIIHGYPDGSFKPNNPITFVEAAKLAVRVFDLNVRRDDNIPDEKWYTRYVQELGSQKAIPTSISRLDEVLTRGEMAEILYRLKADRTDKPSRTWQEFLQ